MISISTSTSCRVATTQLVHLFFLCKCDAIHRRSKREKSEALFWKSLFRWLFHSEFQKLTKQLKNEPSSNPQRDKHPSFTPSSRNFNMKKPSNWRLFNLFPEDCLAFFFFFFYFSVPDFSTVITFCLNFLSTHVSCHMSMIKNRKKSDCL